MNTDAQPEISPLSLSTTQIARIRQTAIMPEEESSHTLDARFALARNYDNVFSCHQPLEVDSYRRFNQIAKDSRSVLKMCQSKTFKDLGELPELTKLQNFPGGFDPSNPYTHTNCIYRVNEVPLLPHLSADYRMCCPFCQLPEEQLKSRYLEEERKNPIYRPLFHGNWNGGYQKHLAHYHGVYKEFVARQPFIGFSKFSDSERDRSTHLVLICPYTKKPNGKEPCLSILCCEEDKRGNLLRKYFEHIYDYHDQSNIDRKIILKKSNQSQIHTLNLGGYFKNSFVPLDAIQFLSTFYDWKEEGLRTIADLCVEYDTTILDQTARMWAENNPARPIMFESSSTRSKDSLKISRKNGPCDPLFTIQILLELDDLLQLKGKIENFMEEPLLSYIELPDDDENAYEEIKPDPSTTSILADLPDATGSAGVAAMKLLKRIRVSDVTDLKVMLDVTEEEVSGA